MRLSIFSAARVSDGIRHTLKGQGRMNFSKFLFIISYVIVRKTTRRHRSCMIKKIDLWHVSNEAHIDTNLRGKEKP